MDSNELRNNIKILVERSEIFKLCLNSAAEAKEILDSPKYTKEEKDAAIPDAIEAVCREYIYQPASVARIATTYINDFLSHWDIAKEFVGEDAHIVTAGEDAHRVTASELFNVPVDKVTAAQRQQAKAVNFRKLYSNNGE